MSDYKKNRPVPEMPIKKQYQGSASETVEIPDMNLNRNAASKETLQMPQFAQTRSADQTLNILGSHEETPKTSYRQQEAIKKEVEVMRSTKQTKSSSQSSRAQEPVRQSSGNVPPRNTNRTTKRQMSPLMNGILVALAVIANLLVLVTLFNTTQFSGLSKGMFILVNALALLMLLVMNIVILMAIRNNNKMLYRVGMVLLALFVLIGGYGTYATGILNRNVDKITNTVVKESVSTSFVVYNEGSAEAITDMLQLEGKTVGLSKGTNTATLAQKQIEAVGLNVSIEEYQDYSAELLALFSGEIDCAVLPTNYKKMFEHEAGMGDLLEKTASILDFEDSVTVENSAGADKDITKEPFTVLLIGNADGLSDTMILCSVNPISMKVTMSSLARDSYVPISCYGGGLAKLNASHASGKDCTIATISNLVGVNIDYYVDTNFQGVVDVVDALGGIVVNSPVEFVGQSSSSERGHYTVYVPKGDNVVLNGEQALAFARERHLFATGDFARQEHQQQVIEAIVRKIMRTRDINTFLKVVEAAGNNVQTNMTVQQMTSFMNYAIKKANRYYDKEHIEKIFNIQNSRVTGYNSGLWDAGLHMSIYIYRLWQGSLAATRSAIERNINLQTTPTSQVDRIKWSVNWDFTPPAISYEMYPEAMIPSEVPPEVEEEEAANAGCDPNTQTLDANGNCVCKAGYESDGYGGCYAVGEQPTEEPTEQPTEQPTEEPQPDTSTEAGCTAAGLTWYDNSCMTYENAINRYRDYCVASGYSWDSGTNTCVQPTPEPSTPEPTPDPTPEVTPEPTPDPTPEKSQETAPPEESNDAGGGSEG